MCVCVCVLVQMCGCLSPVRIIYSSSHFPLKEVFSRSPRPLVSTDTIHLSPDRKTNETFCLSDQFLRDGAT